MSSLDSAHATVGSGLLSSRPRYGLSGKRVRHLRRTKGATQFRIVAGERYAENQQTERLVQRTMVREIRWVSVSKAVILNQLANEKFAFPNEHLLSQLKSSVVYFNLGEMDGTKSHHEKLKDEIKQLRAVLAKTTKSVKQDVGPKYVDRTRAVAQLVAIVDNDEAEELMKIVSEGRESVDSVVGRLGRDRAIRFSNLVGLSDVAIVHDGDFVSTELGKSLGTALQEMTRDAI